MKPSSSLIIALALLCCSSDVEARARPGERAPWFKLKSMTNNTVTLFTLRDKVAALIVGRTYDSAPPCKEWVMYLSKHTAATVYQVIVADKPWYIPRSVILRRIEKFTPKRYNSQVLIEWYSVFVEQYQVPEVREPYVFLIDKKGVIRSRLRTNPTAERKALVKKRIEQLLAER